MNAPLPAPLTDKLAKLVPLLGSDKPGEVLGTVAAIKRTLNSSGRDLHDLARALGKPDPIEWRASPRTRRWEESAWGTNPSELESWEHLRPNERVMALDSIEALRLSKWERVFVANIVLCLKQRPSTVFTGKQNAVLNRLLARAAEGGT